jgi:hypothetical protein
MRVACLTTLDNGNTMRHLARGLRRLPGVEATAYCKHKDWYLHVPDETIDRWSEYPTPPDADAHIIHDHTYIDLDQKQLLPSTPTLVKCNGTFARNYAPLLTHAAREHGATLVSSPCDHSLASRLGYSIQTLGPLTDTHTYPNRPVKGDHPPVIITHCARGTKGTQEILRQLQPYRRRADIEVDIITETPWEENMLRKARSHIYIDQYKPTPTIPGAAWQAFGVSAVESLILGCLVITNPLHPYVHQHYPDQPFITRPTITESLETALQILEGNNHTTNMDRQWALDHFDVENQAPRWHRQLRWMTENP